MRDSAGSHPAGVRPWVVIILLVVAFMVGTGVGALYAQHQVSGTSEEGPACPSAAKNVSWPAPATQVVRYKPSFSATAPVTLQPSETLEVHLFGPWFWDLRTTDGAATLSMGTPAGYVDPTDGGCAWRFTAEQVGAVELQFFGNGMCKVPFATCVATRFNLMVTVRAGA
jgi:hypothetical protein